MLNDSKLLINKYYTALLTQETTYNGSLIRFNDLIVLFSQKISEKIARTLYKVFNLGR